MTIDIHNLTFAISRLSILTGDEVTTGDKNSVAWISKTNSLMMGENNYWLDLTFDENFKLSAKVYDGYYPSTGLSGMYAVIGYLKYHDIPYEFIC